jgi:dTDP-glucose 4,6-dehydratase
MKILVTGGAGFIGSNFVRFVLRERPDASVVNLDKLTYSGNLENLRDVEKDPRYRFVRGDICDAELAAETAAGCDTIVNFAAESHVDRSILDGRPFVTTNVLGTQALLDAARRAKVRRFLQVGTDEVYGSLPLDRPELRFTEDMGLAPNSPYAASKAAADLLVRACHHTHGFDAVITRCSNNFGPYQFPEKVIPLFVANLMEGKQVPLYGDGRNVRDWLHVDDHCRGVQLVADAGRPGEVYNIGGGTELSNRELTERLLAAVGAGWERVRHVDDRLGHDLRYSVDISKIADELGYRPQVTFGAGLAATVAWYREHRDWWEPLKARAALVGS